MAKTASSAAIPPSPRRTNELPQYGHLAPLSNEMRAQCGHTRCTG